MEGDPTSQVLSRVADGGPSSFDACASVQQAHGISTSHGNVVLAGGNVTIQSHGQHYSAPTINILDVLRLVPNLRKIHLDVLSKATPGTGVWFLRTKNFILWLDPNGNLKILWGTGIPGAGKTVMASIVVNDLEARAAAAHGNICVAYVYFRYSDAANLTIRGILEILVKQTVERHPDCAFLAEKAYARHLVERTQPTEADLLQLLQRFTEKTSATFYILDALDEAPERLQVVLVKKLATLNARLFITSRPLKGVEARVPDTCGFPIIAQEGDLNLHIHEEIGHSRDLQSLLDEAGPAFKKEIISSVKTNCGGMFLHASLQLDAIRRCTTTQDVIETLEQFPSEIDTVYRQTWHRICQQPQKSVLLAKSVLLWVLHAARSMTVEELRYAIATSPTTGRFESKRLVSAITLLTLCCGLVAVEDETQFVRLVHYTAKETLGGLLHQSFPRPHSLLAMVCMGHLNQRGFQTTTIQSEEEFTAALQADPLLAHASGAWATYAHESLDDFAISHQVASFVANSVAFPTFIGPSRSDHFDILGPLHIVALYNLPFHLIRRGEIDNPNVLTRSEKASPLLLASWWGQEDTVRDLLRLPNIQVNLTDKDGCSALMLAAQEGHETIVRLFLARPEIQINLADNQGWSALMLAANQGHKGTSKLLLAHPEIEVNLVDKNGCPALITAAIQGHIGALEYLLACPVIQVNLTTSHGWSALMTAASQGHEDVVEILLAQPGIQLNLSNVKGWSALMLAARFGRKSIIRRLLACPEVQINAVDNEGWSALMKAASQGHVGSVQVLLAHDEVQVNLVDTRGQSALMLAASHGHALTVRLLLTHCKIQVTLRDDDGWSALIRAAFEGHEDTVTLLLAHPEAQPNSVDNQGWSALMMAASQGHKGVVEILLSRPEILANIVDRGGWSALMLAANQGHRGVVRRLLDHPSIQVNLVANRGWSALMMAASQGHKSTAKLLLTYTEIDVNLEDTKGWSALMLAVHFARKAIVEALLAHPKIQVGMVGHNG